MWQTFAVEPSFLGSSCVDSNEHTVSAIASCDDHRAPEALPQPADRSESSCAVGYILQAATIAKVAAVGAMHRQHPDVLKELAQRASSEAERPPGVPVRPLDSQGKGTGGLQRLAAAVFQSSTPSDLLSRQSELLDFSLLCLVSAGWPSVLQAAQQQAACCCNADCRACWALQRRAGLQRFVCSRQTPETVNPVLCGATVGTRNLQGDSSTAANVPDPTARPQASVLDVAGTSIDALSAAGTAADQSAIQSACEMAMAALRHDPGSILIVPPALVAWGCKLAPQLLEPVLRAAAAAASATREQCKGPIVTINPSSWRPGSITSRQPLQPGSYAAECSKQASALHSVNSTGSGCTVTGSYVVAENYEAVQRTVHLLLQHIRGLGAA